VSITLANTIQYFLFNKLCREWRDGVRVLFEIYFLGKMSLMLPGPNLLKFMDVNL
jgi:hypothetical protein